MGWNCEGRMVGGWDSVSWEGGVVKVGQRAGRVGWNCEGRMVGGWDSVSWEGGVVKVGQ